MLQVHLLTFLMQQQQQQQQQQQLATVPALKGFK
jgi:hypothetical protein